MAAYGLGGAGTTTTAAAAAPAAASAATAAVRPLIPNSGFAGLEIPPNEIVLLRSLSKNERGEEKGQYGKVFRGRVYGLDVAVKVPQLQNLNERQLEEFRTEVKIMSEINHPNIVRFLGACLRPGNFCLVTELLKGDLGALIGDKSKPFSLYQRLRMAQDIVKGMIFVHQMSIIHEDLKPDNLLYDENYRIKISDFGFSEFKPKGYLLQRAIAKGSYLWMAPEVMMKKPFNEKADVYSFGIILWQLITRLEPYSHHSNVDQFVDAVANRGERPPIPDGTVSPSLRDLLVRCWDSAPKSRPTFGEIDEHLHGVLIESAIMDQIGQMLWMRFFRTHDVVPWPEFSTQFYASVLSQPVPQELNIEPPPGVSIEQLPLEQQLMFYEQDALEQFAQTSPEAAECVKLEEYRRDALAKLSCLRQMLVQKAPQKAADEDVVELERFGRMLTLFGPIDPNAPLNFVNNMKNLMQKDWFYGEMGQEEAYSMLKDQPEGTFLVRFSANKIQPAFTISVVNNNSVVHIRVARSLPDGGYCLAGNPQSFRNLEAMIFSLGGMLIRPCPPRRLAGHPFAPTRSVPGGYKMFATGR